MIFNLLKQKPEARALLDPTPRNPVEWIVANNELPLTPKRIGRFETSEGRVAIVDQLVEDKPDFIEVPTSGCEMYLFFCEGEALSSKFALVFGNEPVMSGNRVDWCAVDSVSVAPVTPQTMASFSKLLRGNSNVVQPYEHFIGSFDYSDMPDARFPGDIHVPYINPGDDGSYPVSVLLSKAKDTLAVFIDFRGRTGDRDDWLIPTYTTD